MAASMACCGSRVACNVSVAPSCLAKPNRESLASTATMTEAPETRATAIARSPVGPHPVTSTDLPAKLSARAASTALPNGSWTQANSGGSSRGVFHKTVSGNLT